MFCVVKSVIVVDSKNENNTNEPDHGVMNGLGLCSFGAFFSSLALFFHPTFLTVSTQC